MDANATLEMLISALQEGDREAAIESLESLLDWLKKDGFMPKPKPVEEEPEVYFDDYSRPCTERRLYPCGGGGNALVGYQSYLEMVADIKAREEDQPGMVKSNILAWESLDIYEGG